MANNHDDELIKIKKREKKVKPDDQIKKKKKNGNGARSKNAPKTNGVRLDFSSEETPKFSRYYMSVSKRYRAARILSAVVLIAFLIVMLVFYRENITYANLMYLVRDLDSENAVSIGAYGDITYDRSFSSDFEIFRNRIAIASTKGFTLYSRTGSEDLVSEEILADPRLEVSDKYALMYDAGTNKYFVFTTIAKVLSAQSEFNIEDAAVSDSGRYALLSDCDKAKALITVYNQDFIPITEYYKDKYVIDIALDDDGEHLASASCDIRSSEVTGELVIGKVSTQDKVSFEYPGMMPLQVEYTDDGRLVMLCDTALIIFEGEKEYARVDFEGLVPGCFDINGGIIAVSFPTNVIGSENLIKVFDTEGKELYNVGINEKITVVSTDGSEAVYTVGDSCAVRLSLSDGGLAYEETREQPLGAIAVPGSLIVCSPDGTGSYFAKAEGEADK